jgi:kynurenine formamidase
MDRHFRAAQKRNGALARRPAGPDRKGPGHGTGRRSESHDHGHGLSLRDPHGCSLRFLSGGAGLDSLPLDAVIGEARVIEIKHPEFVSADELGLHDIRKGERLLLKTGNSARCWKSDIFVPDFAHLTTKAARFLAGRGIRTVGIDYLSVGGYHAKGDEVHRALLQGGVWIIEGLDLSGISPGTYEQICLPLRVLNSDGAPARAVLGMNKESGHGNGV